jgi:hypothetical protein
MTDFSALVQGFVDGERHEFELRQVNQFPL